MAKNKTEHVIQTGISWAIGFGILAATLMVLGLYDGFDIGGILLMAMLGGIAGIFKGFSDD